MLKSAFALTLFCCASILPAFGAAEEKSRPMQTDEPLAGCTALPQSEWLSEDEFKVLMRYRGYRDFRLKIAYHSCYEIYGYDAKNQLVEAYFNPTNAKPVRINTVKLR